jgi:hypothetical protein
MLNTNTTGLWRAVLVAALGTLLAQTTLISATAAKKDKNTDKAAHTGPDSVVVFIGNRLFPDFAEIATARLHEKCQVGDTDYSFVVEQFNPHFTIIDSTKAIVALSDEPKNPAFRIKVYQNDAAVDSSWAFYNMDVPHFSRTSALWFRVLCFDYRGVVFKKEPPAPPKDEKAKSK